MRYTEKYKVKTNPMLNKDYYKEFHGRCLPKGMTKSVSYFTPRKSRVKMWDEVVVHGYQAFIKQHIIDDWNVNFFSRPKYDVVEEYARIIENCMGRCDRARVMQLYDLGYLPIEIYALPEGTLCPMHVPFFSITNTHPDFAWLPQALESLISAEMWYPMVTATVGHTYRKIVNKYYDMTVDNPNSKKKFALGNFDYRGDMGTDAAMKAGSGWLLSFANTATVGLVPYMETMYNCDCTKEIVGRGANSTEHFVMCSNSAYDSLLDSDDFIDNDPHRERTFIKKLLTEICPNESFSCVCDSYDYWNVVNNILPSLKEEIMNHNGTLLVRGDSGNPIEIVTKTVYALWDIFGGTINSKGYKVLDPHVKAIYGDSIQIETAEKIYEELVKNKFSVENVALGVGSFSMHCIIEDGVFKPFTRDTFSMAIKACYAEINGMDYAIYKDPKTDSDTGNGFKKSQKGCCRVYYGENGKLTYKDNLTYNDSLKGTELVPIFRNGELLVDQSLQEIRNRLNKFEF